MAFNSRFNKSLKKGMTFAWCRSKFWMELYANKPRVHSLRQFHNLRQSLARRTCRNHQTGFFKRGYIVIINLIAMAVAFIDFSTIDSRSQGAEFDRTALRTQAHGTAKIGISTA